MDDPNSMDELELETVEEPEPLAERRERRLTPWIVAALVLLILALAVYFFYFRGRGEEPAEVPAPAAEPAEAEPAEPAEAQFPEDLPELDQSDGVIRDLVATVSSHPELSAWMVNDDLARRFVVAVDNLAEGGSPRTHLQFLAPRGSFRVAEREAGPIIDPAGYRRYDLIAEVFSSLDAQGTAELYQHLKPLFQQAYSELGYPNRDFDRTLKRAIDRLLDTPIRQGDIYLEPRVSSYEFADPALEILTPAQKQLLRMGPENVAKVQRKLRALADALELDAQ